MKGKVIFIVAIALLATGCSKKEGPVIVAEKSHDTTEENIVYCTVEEAEQEKDTISKLQKRAKVYDEDASVTEAEDGTIKVSLPNASDPTEILQKIISVGMMEWKDEEDKVVISNDMIKSAKEVKLVSQQDGATEYGVEVTFTEEGAKILASYTKANMGTSLAIYCDGKILSEATINCAITDGICQITGESSSEEEAKELATIIDSGALLTTVSIK